MKYLTNVLFYKTLAARSWRGGGSLLHSHLHSHLPSQSRYGELFYHCICICICTFISICICSFVIWVSVVNERCQNLSICLSINIKWVVPVAISNIIHVYHRFVITGYLRIVFHVGICICIGICIHICMMSSGISGALFSISVFRSGWRLGKVLIN